MEHRTIGRLSVPLAGIGCNNFGMRLDADQVRGVVDAAFEVGATHFDTAESYGGGHSEEFLGRALRGRREDAIVTTKFGFPTGGVERPGSAANVARCIAASLDRLGMDHVDLYLLHRPDPTTPITETLEAMARLVAAGKVREIGGSGFSAEQLVAADTAARELGVQGFVNIQNEYSLLDRSVEREVLPECDRLGVSFVPYFPLASGMLTGKYRRGEGPPAGTRLATWGDRGTALLSDDNFETVGRLEAWARPHGHTLHELALSYLSSAPVVASVICGAMSPEQVRANAAATTAWTLSEAERAEVAGLAAGG